MSNSIWKMPDQRPENDNDIVFVFDDLPITGYYEEVRDTYVEHATGENYYKNELERWAYVTDIIAQADKAERLQKAVDYALQVLDNLTEIGGVDLQIIKIKQLIKETTNDK